MEKQEVIRYTPRFDRGFKVGLVENTPDLIGVLRLIMGLSIPDLIGVLRIVAMHAPQI